MKRSKAAVDRDSPVTFRPTEEVRRLLDSLPSYANKSAAINEALARGLPALLSGHSLPNPINDQELLEALKRLERRKAKGGADL